MSDRTSKPFEPPPWEKEQFEELARRRRASEQPGAVEPVHRVVHEAGVSEVTTGPKENVLPAEADLLLSRLRTQESGSSESLWKTGLVLTSGVAIIGVVLVVWGITGLATIGETGAAGATGGSIMIFFGLFFVGVAAWLGVRIMRKRGVL